jgi:hypothetical protein
MALIHSKKPKAFQENIRSEIHAGKPQKQAVAIAYSVKRKAEKHKYASGGCAGAGCPGPHFDDGGEVKTKNQNAGSNNSATNEAGVASASDIWNNVKGALGGGNEAQAAPRPHPDPGMAKGGEVKSLEDHLKEKERKLIEHKLRFPPEQDEEEDALHPSDKPENYHFLGKYAEGGGVHEQASSGNYSDEPGVSHAGQLVRGAHRDNSSSSMMKRDYAKMKISSAKRLHEENLSESRSMPNPKLKGLAEGGEVEGDMDIKEPGHYDDVHEDRDHDYDSEIHDMLGKELMEAFHSKDHKRMAEGLEAMILQCLDDKEGE